jgi:hypothetical protein
VGIDRYGCPDIEEIENFNRLYKQKLDEIIERGEISLDLALEASYLTELSANGCIFSSDFLTKFYHCRYRHQVQRGF